MIPLLRPLFRDDWASYGEAWQCSAERPRDAVLLADLLQQPGRLEGVLQRHAAHWRMCGPDMRAVASAWALHYLELLLPASVATASLLQHDFDLRADRIAVRLDATGSAVGFHLPDEGRPGSGRVDERYDALLRLHLAPLFGALQARTRVAPKILWGNTARHFDNVFAHALALVGPQPALLADRAWLLEQPAWPGGRDNPMHVAQREVVARAGQAPMTLHRQCCLYYLLPGQGHCGACPLDPRHRAAMKAPARTPVTGATPSG